jgi:hypothetical protein
MAAGRTEYLNDPEAPRPDSLVPDAVACRVERVSLDCRQFQRLARKLSYLVAPIELFIAAGIFMSACAVASLLFGSARDHCHQRAPL